MKLDREKFLAAVVLLQAASVTACSRTETVSAEKNDGATTMTGVPAIAVTATANAVLVPNGAVRPAPAAERVAGPANEGGVAAPANEGRVAGPANEAGAPAPAREVGYFRGPANEANPSALPVIPVLNGHAAATVRINASERAVDRTPSGRPATVIRR